MKKGLLKKSLALCCSITMLATSVPITNVSAADFTDDSVNVMVDKGGYKTEVFGVRTEDWGQTWTDRKDSLPPSKVYLTDNYKETVGTVPTNDWASSVVFDQYSESLYAHPLAYRAASNGMQMASPAVVDSTSYVDGEPTVESLLEDDTVELVVGGDSFSAKDASVDKTTDWSYEIVMANKAGSSSMRAIIAKGTPYAYYTFDNMSPTISLGAGATDLAIVKNTTASNIIGVSLKNKKDGKTHYYMLSAPSGTTWTNAGGKLTAKLPAGKNYMSVAILPDGSNEAFSLYEKYAFNFITDTKVQWEYLNNSAKVVTKYNVTTKNMETGAVGGDTIMALYPHQWRYTEADFTKYTYNTIRGTMKTVVGSSYVTQMQYNGILSTLPTTTDEETVGKIKEQLGYLYDYRKKKDDPKWICYLEGQYGGYDTYWVGKNLNTMADAIWLSGQLDNDDTDMKTITDEMVDGVKDYLEFWFDPYQGYISGNYKDDYFYYDKNYGTLIGYPSSYDSDKQVNDHHFHYGYWIKAAAAVAMEKPEWAKEWGGMVYEMIGDIANVHRDGKGYNENSSTRYPFLRNFDIYEGHSWASGVANYEYDENGELVDKKGGLAGGNNQESSSESINAWASLILWGEAVGDKEVRDAGIYMYTTEVAAIEDYYYDVHDEIFTDKYEDKDNYNIQTVTRLFGGRYDHTAWWTENSIEVTTITMLPISGATLYMGKYKDKVKNVVDSIDENSKQWQHFVANKNQICTNYGKKDMLIDPKTNQDVIAEYYAYYDPDGALARWDQSDTGKVENGESRAHTLSYITSLQKYGNQDFSITGSDPLSLVLSKDGKKTYVAENHTDQVKRVYFTDDTYVDVPANSSYVGKKTGDGANPNIDDSELLGNTTKVTVENYLENYAGNGYDMTSSQVSVKEGETSYTYQPQNITGFNFDSSNKGNVLTTAVKEDNSSVVKAYYERNNYTISYVLNGGVFTNAQPGAAGQNAYGGNPTNYRYGSSIKLVNPTKAGYKFEGWFADSNYENEITEITPTTAGDLTLYAKFVDESIITNFTVEYYKQSEDRSEYNLVEEDTVKVTSIVGKEVSAVEKTYDGYKLNENSITTGVVLPNGKLILRLYYDIDQKTSTNTDRGAYIGSDGKLNFVVKDNAGRVLLYYKVVSKQAEAEAFYNEAVASNGGNCPGYFMEKSGDGFKKVANETVSGSDYVIYRFNIDDKEFTDWNLAQISDLGNAGTNNKKANYSVKYFVQDKDQNEYTENKNMAVTVEGTVGEAVVATKKNVVENNNVQENNGQGFTVNVKKSSLFGVVKEDGSLELKVYYDRNTYAIDYNGLGNATHSNPSTYVYGNAVKLTNPVGGEKFQGWYLDDSYTQQISEIAEGTLENIVLYAKFKNSQPATTKPAETPKPTTKPGETTDKPGEVTTKPGETTNKSDDVTTKPSGTTEIPATSNPATTGNGETTKPSTTTGTGEVTTAPGKTTGAGEVTTAPGKTTKPGTSVTTKIKRPAKVKKIKLKKKISKKSNGKFKRKISIKWKKLKGVTGYQIAIRIGKKGKFKVVKKIKKNKRKYIKSKVKLGKTYYVKVRAYRKVGKKVVYGKYSKAKKCKFKK